MVAALGGYGSGGGVLLSGLVAFARRRRSCGVAAVVKVAARVRF